MADKKADATPVAASDSTAATAAKKKSPMKAIGLIAVLMIAEAGAVYFFVGKTAPQAAAAHGIVGKDEPNLEASIEIPLVEEKFQNMQTGRVWVWDTEIVLKVKAKNEKFVEKQLEERAAEIKEGVSMIFRRAQHSSLKEPGLETVNRQLRSLMNELIGKDADGKERIERIVIPKCKGFPAD